MGVYIKGMSKPKDCKECKFCIVEAKVEGKIYPLNAYCFVQHQNLKDFDECPLIEIVRCGECKHFNLNEWDETISGVPIIVAHEICHKWGNGCKTDSNGFCFMGERRADDNTIKTNI